MTVHVSSPDAAVPATILICAADNNAAGSNTMCELSGVENDNDAPAESTTAMYVAVAATPFGEAGRVIVALNDAVVAATVAVRTATTDRPSMSRAADSV